MQCEYRWSFLIGIWPILLIGCLESKLPKPLQKAEVLIEKGEPQSAVPVLENFVSSYPLDPIGHMKLGDTYSLTGQTKKAIAEFREAISLLSNQPKSQVEARIKIVRAYLRIGDRKRANLQLKAILRSGPPDEVLIRIAGYVTDAYHITRLTKGKSDNYSPSFSPDGRQIAFSSFRLDNGEIYLMDLTGRIRQRVTFSTDFNETTPVFLRDPNYLLYCKEPKASREISVTLQGSGSTRFFAGIDVSHIYNKTTQELLPVKLGVRAPSASLASDHILYESNLDGNLEIYRIDFTDKKLNDIGQVEPERLTHSEDSDDGTPRYNPLSGRIIFVAGRNNVHQLYSFDPNTGSKSETQLLMTDYDCYNPAISPDGKHIAFVAARDGDIEVCLMDVDGTNVRQITNGIGISIHPTFSPDGRQLAFVSDRSDSFHVYLMDLDRPKSAKILSDELRNF
ncbi:hypothetical protein CMK20_09435 [Candidatus Poribacteria bacterium]|nr:hypothetical protein [Candidatus Poribacteria bacterium]